MTTATPETLITSWHAEARCRNYPDVEMVPGGDFDAGTPLQVWRAKLVCRGCPVAAACLVEALADDDQGVRAGLTYVERERLRLAPATGIERRVLDCAGCGLSCVPRRVHDPRCDDCLGAPVPAEEARPEIEALLAAGYVQRSIVTRTGIPVTHLARACRRWGLTPQAGPRGHDTVLLEPCGTEAARARHRRDRLPREEWTCACRLPIKGMRANRRKSNVASATEHTEERTAA